MGNEAIYCVVVSVQPLYYKIYLRWICNFRNENN